MPPRTKPSMFGGRIEDAFGRFLRRMPKQSRSRALVSAIVQALDEQLASGADMDSLTVEAVSERAGVGVGSFYEYFTGKDSLLGALVGRVTDHNFTHLAARLDEHAAADLDELIRVMSRELAATYLAHPQRTRVVVRAIGRLRLLQVVGRERDRFAELMAERVSALLPTEDRGRLGRTMQLVADGGMGILVSAAERDPPDDRHVVASELTELATALIRERHGEALTAGRDG